MFLYWGVVEGGSCRDVRSQKIFLENCLARRIIFQIVSKILGYVVINFGCVFG